MLGKSILTGGNAQANSQELADGVLPTLRKRLEDGHIIHHKAVQTHFRYSRDGVKNQPISALWLCVHQVRFAHAVAHRRSGIGRSITMIRTPNIVFFALVWTIGTYFFISTAAYTAKLASFFEIDWSVDAYGFALNGKPSFGNLINVTENLAALPLGKTEGTATDLCPGVVSSRGYITLSKVGGTVGLLPNS